MKTLHLVRHGKSSWDMPGISDIDRPLIEKGMNNAYSMSRELEIKYGIPDMIICSSANRAIHTAIIFARTMRAKMGIIKIDEKIYEASTSTIIDIIEETSSKINKLLIVGHNPTFTDLANLFLPQHLDNLPTLGIVTMRFETKDWNIIDKTPVFTEVNFPKKE